MALFLVSNLSDIVIKAPFILLLSFVISCMPSTNRRWKSSLPIYLYFINTRVIGTLRILQAHHRWLPLLGEDEGMRMMIC